MARTNIDVIITVRDGASRPLVNIEKQLSRSAKAFKDINVDIWQFNKTIFSAMAFVGLFTRSFSSLISAMDIGAPLERLTAQFERVMGPKGELLDNFKNTTNSIVDHQILMSGALKLAQTGVTKTSRQTSDILGMMAVAGRMAGQTGTEGVQVLSEAFADYNINALAQLNMLRKSNPELLAQFAVIGKSAGILGNAVVKQQQYAIMLKILTEHTKDHMFMTLSTGEVVEGFSTSLKNLRHQIGIYLSTALRPLLEKSIYLFESFSKTISTIVDTNKNLVFLGKTVMGLIAGFSSLFFTLGSLKLLVRLLGYGGIGIPGLVKGFLALGATFLGLTKKANTVIDKFTVIGGVFKGIYELVENFDPETGLSKISESTRNLLEKHGLLGFVKTISRIIVVIKTVLKDMYTAFKTVAKAIDNIFGELFEKFKNVISNFSSKWDTWWTTDSLNPIEKFVRAATVLLAPILGLFAFKGTKLFLAKVTGGLFGSKNDGSSPAKAIWVQNIKDIVSGVKGLNFEKLKDVFSRSFPIFSTNIRAFFASIPVLTQGLGAFKTLPILLRVITPLAGKFVLITALVGALYGAVLGVVDGFDGIKKFFVGLFEFNKALGGLFVEFLRNIPGVSSFLDVVSEGADLLKKVFEGIFSFFTTVIPQSFRLFFKDITKGFGMTGDFLSFAAQGIEEKTRRVGFSRQYEDFLKGGQFPKDIPKTEEQKISNLSEVMKHLNRGQVIDFKNAVAEAMKSVEADGSKLSDKEYAFLFAEYSAQAFDKSSNVKKLVQNTTPNNNKGFTRPQ